MKLRKFLALALAVTTVLSMSVLTGCSSNSGSSSEKSAETTETGETAGETKGEATNLKDIKIGLMIRISSMLQTLQRKHLDFLMSRSSLKPIFLRAVNVMKQLLTWQTVDAISCLQTALGMNSISHRPLQNSRMFSSVMQQEQRLIQQVQITSTMHSRLFMKVVIWLVSLQV